MIISLVNGEDVLRGTSFKCPLRLCSLGTWGTDEAEEAAKYNKKPGDIKYWDKNGNGMKDGEDQDYIGKWRS